MFAKAKVKQLVLEKNNAALIELARNDAKRVIRYLMRLTYTTDDLLRHQAVEALGVVADFLVELDQELVTDIIRRIIWSMCDESGAQSWSAPEIIGEIVYYRPKIYGQFASIMINASMDEVIFQRGMLWAIGRMRDKVAYSTTILPDIIKFLDHPRAVLRGNAAWALGELRAVGATEKLGQLVNDTSTMPIYIDGRMYHTTVGELARASLAKVS